ncbi:MAG: M20/M25/M40 family metallo-hydrolase [Candidatus Micrarchaeia archaeon]
MSVFKPGADTKKTGAGKSSSEIKGGDIAGFNTSEKAFTRKVLSMDSRTRIIESLGSMVAVKTVSGPGETPDYEGFEKVLREEAAMRKLSCEQIGKHVGNWLVKMQNEDPEKQTMLIAVHADVVSVGDRKDWKTDPFEFTVDGDSAYGRGAADCKSGIVVGLEAMYRLQKENPKVKVRMLVGRDEETGSELGFKYLAENNLLKADAALVWDTRPVITVASSGVIGAKIEFHGAVSGALGIFDAIQEYSTKRNMVESEYYATEAPRPKLWGRVTPTIINFQVISDEEVFAKAIWGGEKTNSVPASCYVSFGISTSALGAGIWKEIRSKLNQNLSPGFEIVKDPEGILGTGKRRSVQIEIQGKGGHAGYPHQTLNPIPEAIRLVREYIKGESSSFYLGVDARALPEENIMAIKNELIDAFKKNATPMLDDGKWSVHSPCMLGKNQVNDALVGQVQAAFGAQGLDTKIYGGLGGLDLDMLIKAGIPSLAAGPQNKSIHGPNEYVSLSQIEKFINLTVDLAVNWESLPGKTSTEG